MRIVASVILLACSSATVADTGAARKDALRHLHISPDGRFVLAQDASEVTVLTVQPFAVLFRVPAETAADAQFTPDSRQVLFVTGATRVDSQRIMLEKTKARVERWSIADRARVDSTEVPWRACGTERLSPDGRSLACVDLEGTLRLVDVASKETFLEQPEFGRALLAYTGTQLVDPMRQVEVRTVTRRHDPGAARIAFSPDGRFFVAVQEPVGNGSLAWDVRDRRALKLEGGLKLLKWGAASLFAKGEFFAFVAPDRLMVSSRYWAKHGVVTARLLAFPSGRVLSNPKLPPGQLFRAADPDFVLVRPDGDIARRNDSSAQRTAAVELATGKIITSETPAMDVFGRYYVAECANDGELRLYDRGKGLQATVAFHKR